MGETLLKKVAPKELMSRRVCAVDNGALKVAAQILDDVERGGEGALREIAQRLSDLRPGEPFFVSRAELDGALDSLPRSDRALLERTAGRIAAFATAQRESLREIEVPVPGGRAAQLVAPVERAGCYAPGGRFPLPSSVLMTAVTARAAGVADVCVASPRPAQITLAAAAVAGCDGFLRIGGAQAMAAFAFGLGDMAPRDVVVGPGNKYVTAAKKLLYGRIGIDLLAGPSELLVIADETAEAKTVAADILAQAEHDEDAVPTLISLDEGLVGAVEEELSRQLADLPTRETARAALRSGRAAVTRDLDEAIRLADEIAPEHLELCLRDERLSVAASRLRHYGALFVGSLAAEVLGDYGAGPNHTLPTGGTARFSGGLSVLHFLRVRTALHIDDREAARELTEDSVRLAELEGLAAHARSAARRRP